MNKAYIIRRKSDGLHSNGKDMPNFSRTGKLWLRISDIKSHLTRVGPAVGIYRDCEIVTLHIQEEIEEETNEVLRRKLFRELY